MEALTVITHSQEVLSEGNFPVGYHKVILLETDLEMSCKITAFPERKYYILLHNDSMRAMEVRQDRWSLSNPALAL